jgi:hypothetical protein
MATKIEHGQAEWPAREVNIGKSLEECLEGKSQFILVIGPGGEMHMCAVSPHIFLFTTLVCAFA